MKNTNRTNKPGHITHGDIFDDLGFSREEVLEAKIKAEIWQALIQHIDQHGFTQAQLVTALKAHQPDVSNLLKGKISRFSITKLIQFAGRLNLTPQIKMTAAKTPLPPQSLKASAAKANRSKSSLAHAATD